MGSDPQQVDWNYQIRNIPADFPPGGAAGGDLSGTYPNPTVAKILNEPLSMAGIAAGKVLTWSGSVWAPATPTGGLTGVFQINPNSGPFTGTTLTVDHLRGLKATSGPNLTMELASLIQAGVIGTVGLQQFQGPNFNVGSLAVGGIPSWAGTTWAGVVQDGRLGFFDSGLDSFTTNPGAWIDWNNTTARVFTIHSTQGLRLVNDGGGGATIISNAAAPNNITLGGVAGGITTYDPSFIDFSVGGSELGHAHLAFNSGVNQWIFSLNRTGSPTHTMAYAIGINFGQTGSLTDGSVVTGGIITTIGSGTSSVPSGPAGGDLSGTYPNPGVAKIEGYPLAISSPATDDVLYWTGTHWVSGVPPIPWSVITGAPTTLAGYGITNAIASGSAAGGDLSGTYPNPGVAKIGGSPVSIGGSPTTGALLRWSGSAWADSTTATVHGLANGSDTFSLDGAGGLASSVGGNVVISQNAAGKIVVGGTFGTLTLNSTGAISLLGANGSEYASDASGNVTIKAGTSHSITISSPTGGTSLQLDNAGNVTVLGPSSVAQFLMDNSSITTIGGAYGLLADNTIGIVLAGPGYNLLSYSHSAGLQLLTSSVDKFGCFASTPVVQQTSHGTTSGYVAHTTANLVYDATTFTGGSGSTAYTIGDLVLALKNYGWIKT